MYKIRQFFKRHKLLLQIPLAFGVVVLLLLLLVAALVQFAPDQLQRIPFIDPSLTLLGAIPFKHVVIDERPPGGDDCCTDVAALGDINGDGYLDVLIGSEHANSDGLVWYAYPEWSRYPIADGDFSTDGEVADVDGDGDADVVVSSSALISILWYENKGDPTRKENWQPHLIGVGFAHDLAVGDIDGDGRVDVVIKQLGEGSLKWFQAPVDRTTAWAERVVEQFDGEGVDLGDIDGDGDLDIASSHVWYENLSSAGDQWQKHEIVSDWRPDTRTIIADINQDGRQDIVLSSSEHRERLAWFENPDWTEHRVARGTFYGVHSLEVADFDNDGAPDIFMAEVHRSWMKQILVFRNQGQGSAWERVPLGMTGSHNARAGDIDQDGDIDIVGKNYAGASRPLDLWQNMTIDAEARRVWRYHALDESRPDSQYGKMGLVFADANQDGHTDVVAGSYLYLNPGGDLQAQWMRVELPEDIDVYFATNVDGDEQSDLIGISNNRLLWIEAIDNQATSWQVHPVGTVPEGRTQGYLLAQIAPGDKPELVFTRSHNLFYVEIPATNPEQTEWPQVPVTWDNEEEGVAAGDIDGDGDLDLAAQASDGHHAIWLENPGDGSYGWPRHVIAGSDQWLDRIALVDLNGDGRLDLVETQETQDRNFNAQIFWLEGPADPKNEPWPRHYVDVLRSANSLDWGDMDGDGDLDIIAAEHTDMRRRSIVLDNLTLWYENQENGARWIPHLVEIGRHSSHLGARAFDLDGDGDLDIVSPAWRQYRQLHLWQNLSREQEK